MYDFYDKVLHKLGQEKGKNTIYINIGAMDGIMFDDGAGYVAMYEYLPLYVEPIPYLYERLKNNIKDPRARFENSAISDFNGTVQMLTIDGAAIDEGHIHECFYGMSSIYPPRNGLALEGDKEVVQKYGKLETVSCITLETLFEKHNITEVDIISIDAEGHDWKILQQLDLSMYKPSVIRAEYINLNDIEKQEISNFFSTNGYITEVSGQNIDAIPVSLFNQLFNITSLETNNNTTIVTGLWNLGRGEIDESFKRSYDHYREKFAELLRAPDNMFIYASKEDEDFIWQHRDRTNTRIKIMEREEFDNWFAFFNKVQEIRELITWKEQAQWLTQSPQATLKYYNPVVMSKMFMLNDVTLFNPFNSEYFYWIDAGITNTVHSGYFYHDKVFSNLPEYTAAINRFLFLSYPYIGGEEIHGFPRKEMARHCETDYVKYVCRGGFFGGKRKDINIINGLYYDILSSTLTEGLMGTEESIFTILAHKHPELISRFELGDDGMVWPFFEKLKDVKSFIQETPKLLPTKSNAKNNLYILGFNSPIQFNSVAESIKKIDPVMYERSRKILVNNSIDESLFEEYDRLCEIHNFEEIHLDNRGVCGGRQYIAEHFDKSDADFYMFFEDDMHLAEPDVVGHRCKHGFSTYVDNLYNKVIDIMIREKFDFLKFSFTEFYGNNSIQWAWYNVPQQKRSEYWPTYDKLPTHGLDPNAPRTRFTNIETLDGISYIKGEIYYSNWPQIVSRMGNKKMFLDTTWARPFEQTWMSHIFQLIKEDKLTAGILLASPINHDRFEFYEGTLRKES